MATRMLVFALAGALAVLPGVAAAQGTTDWTHGTTLAGFGGLTVAGSGSNLGGAAGGTLGWEIWPYLTVEGSGTWMADGNADGFAGLLSSRIGLAPRSTVVPFVSAGLGVYHASLDATSADVPAFYGRRMNGEPVPRRRETFDDFLMAFGGGIDLYVTRHVAVRPDVRFLVTLDDGNSRTMTLIGVHLAYHFEDHPVTP